MTKTQIKTDLLTNSLGLRLSYNLVKRLKLNHKWLSIHESDSIIERSLDVDDDVLCTLREA